MSVRALSAVFDVRGVSISERAVLLVCANQADDSGYTWMRAQTVAERLEVHTSTVRRAFADLEERGLMVRLHPGGGRGIPALRRVLPGVLADDVDAKGLRSYLLTFPGVRDAVAQARMAVDAGDTPATVSGNEKGRNLRPLPDGGGGGNPRTMRPLPGSEPSHDATLSGAETLANPAGNPRKSDAKPSHPAPLHIKTREDTAHARAREAPLVRYDGESWTDALDRTHRSSLGDVR